MRTLPSRAERPLPVEIGRYRVERLLGRGAMGRVLLARDPVLDRDVAVKLLRDDLELPEEQRTTLLDRMRQEARAAARVSHPNIVALHDMGEDERLGLYLVFEYLDGETLKERLERGPLGPLALATLAREIGGALSTAHQAGVLHRDIKPDNIILTRTGAKIADFGIARVPDSTLTLGGGLLGTPAYSAPEALSGGRFSPQSDQFSMAATLYEALSGRRAFPGDDAVAVANRITTEEPPRIAMVCGVDPHVDAVMSQAFSKNPHDRFQTCEDFGRALADALELSPRSTMPTLPDERHRPIEPLNTRRARAVAGGAAIGALVTIVAFQLTAHLRPSPEPEKARAAASVATVQAPRYEAQPVAWLAERPAAPHVTLTRVARTVRRNSKAAGLRDSGAADGSDTVDGGAGDGGQHRDAGARRRPRGKP